MKLIATLLLFSFSVLSANSQPAKKSEKKYQGLLWEISGNGLAKPSYLFGTMHVSNKLAFHLADSFYNAIKSVDVVALETNPANWQDDYSKPNIFDSRSGDIAGYAYKALQIPNDYIHKNTFAIDKYESNVKLAMSTEPAMINGMLYRTYNQGADFEEDTYLDMYIFQTGSKLGKKMTGVENFEESEKLVAQAYKDAAKEKRNKNYEPDYNYDDYLKSPYSIEDAYRKGDLDMLDSLEGKQFTSKAFLEKFLYKRNEIQANSIDSIIKSKTSLFVGVGSAHLPGKRGVIEMLRSKGYTLRAVRMGERDGQQKDVIDKIRVPVNFRTIESDDKTFSVEIPGEKFYSFSRLSDLNIKQYADMGNGAYYVVSRIKTNGLLLGENETTVYKKVDSLLYENIPGKILKKSPIVKNGYKGFDVTNRTRRGDIQRYNIIVTPFEILFFKISGIGDYVLEGGEANRFFNSINIVQNTATNWINFYPATGGFEIKLPHTPILQKDFEGDRLEYTATDSKENITYTLMKANLHNYGFIEEDTFDLNLMDESFASSDVIEKQVSRQQGKWQGYPVLDCKYKHKDGSFTSVRYLLQGPNYFAQLAHYTTETKNVKQYFDAFKITPFIYPEVKLRVDTAMHFTVQSPLFPDMKKQNELMENLRNMMDGYGYGDNDDSPIPEFGVKLIGNDTIGEKIFVAWAKSPKNTYLKDSTKLFSNSDYNFSGSDNKDQSYLYLKRDSGITANGMRYLFQQVTDTNSSRKLISKAYYKSGNYFMLMAMTDTLTPASSLLSNFIQTFTPSDTVKGESPFVKRNGEFFKDFAGKDSATHAKAMKRLKTIDFDSSDVQSLRNIIDTLSWKTKGYLQLKQTFIARLKETKDNSLVDYLKQLYVAAKDTADLQNSVLHALLGMQTKRAFTAFKDVIIMEPPVVTSNNGSNDYDYASVIPGMGKFAKKFPAPRRYYDYKGEWNQLYDTLSLAKVVFPDILQLINLDDYKSTVMELLTTMVDSGYVSAKDYELYFSKFYVEAKQELKKERANESQKAIAKAEKVNKADSDDEINAYSRKGDGDSGNELLQSYSVLLLPYWDKNPGVPAFFDDIMKLKNKQIRFNTMLLLLRNKKTVPDSLLNFYASDEEYRVDLYRNLKRAKLLDKFPAKYNNQSDLVKSAIMNSSSYDTIALMEKMPVTYKNKKGFVYFFKYKNKKEEKKWKILSYGMQPENTKEFDDDNDDFTSETSYSYNRSEDDKLDETKPEREQLQKLMKTMLYKMHSSAAQFYNGRNDDSYNDVLTEKIKTNRYGD
ncbi:TraB/GumN family protein [Ferruginibacter sp. SUN106]|uniref:TraB/GumN family protein n=1 Tax=Ferruginibacter sp. SUN106 TaxID=2978348 RepID=UPI003D36662B